MDGLKEDGAAMATRPDAVVDATIKEPEARELLEAGASCRLVARWA